MASPFAVSYRRLRSFSSDFITIQSKSPLISEINFGGSAWRWLAVSVSSVRRSDVTIVEGSCGSFSRKVRRISSSPDFIRMLVSNGVRPVSNS